MSARLLPGIRSPRDLKALDLAALETLAGELRDAIVAQVSRSGGHLAPNLGVVELTLALHWVFDLPHDRLLFDVGHQCYAHKLLTGRGHLFGRLRQRGGMSGFPEPRESPYDLFSVGHAGTAISTAVGMARADTLLGQGDRRVVALIGDASIVNGVALEGLNGAGALRRQLLVVLNDNGMSIARPQGALARSFAEVRADPGSSGSGAFDAHALGAFGLECRGPVDGHDLGALVETLRALRDLERPVLLHAKTVKGRGVDFCTGDPTAFHSPAAFTVEGCRVVVGKSGRSFTAAFGDALLGLMQRDERVFAVTAAMPDGTGVARVLRELPERSLDTGICESHAMDMCAGMARAGLKPFLAVYSTFAQRALDQVFQEVALQGLAVRVCMDRAGFVGGDGAVHHGFMDVALFRTFPRAALLAACDEPTLAAALEFMRHYDDGASFLRYPRDRVAPAPLEDPAPPFILGRANLVRRAATRTPALAVLAYGTQVYEALAALARLGAEADDVALWDARFAKPIDRALLRSLVEKGVPILTVEDHFATGGFGTAVLEALNEERLSTDGVRRLGMPERWIYQASRAQQLAEAGLDANAIAESVRALLSEGRPAPAAEKRGSRAPGRRRAALDRG